MPPSLFKMEDLKTKAVHTEEAPVLASDLEKMDTNHDDMKPEVLDLMMIDTERVPEARGKTMADVSWKYWLSPLFLGSYIAVLMSAIAGIGGFSLIIPLLGNINNDIGPSNNITWIPLIWTVTQGLVFMICGRLTDIFGRRWILIFMQSTGLIGSIWASQATTVNQLVGASAFMGLASGTGLSFYWIISEIVPFKYRYMAVGTICGFCVTSPLGPKIGFTFQTQYAVHWRGCYYLLIACNTIAMACYYFFYHPPTFKMLHRRNAIGELLRTCDWIGLVLYTAGVIVLLMGLNWGGSIYPWKSAQVIGSILGGTVGLGLLVLWEWWMPLKETVPFLPLHLFTNLPFMAVTLLTSIGSAAYFGLSFVWPAACTTLYPGLSASYTGTIYGLVPMCILYAQCLTGFLGTWTIAPKKIVIIAMTIATPLIALVAVDPLNLHLTLGFVISGCIAIGLMDGLALTMTTYPLRTQEEIGTAGGLSGTMRAFVGSISIAIYSAVLKARLATTIPANVYPAVEKTGLPTSSLPALLDGLAGLTPLNATEGITPHIIAVAEQAYRVAHAQSYKTVFLVTLAFSVPGVVLVWFIKDAPKAQEEFIASHIHHKSDEKMLEEQN